MDGLTKRLTVLWMDMNPAFYSPMTPVDRTGSRFFASDGCVEFREGAAPCCH